MKEKNQVSILKKDLLSFLCSSDFWKKIILLMR